MAFPLAGLPSPLWASVDVLVVGGGSTPASSAVALEQNVLDYKADLKTHVAQPTGVLPRHVFLYGAGPGSALLDVAEARPEVDAEALLFARVVQGPNVDASLAFRSNRIEGLDGPATQESVVAALEAQVKRAGVGHRSRFFFTGHGLAGGPRDNPHSRNEIALWKGTLDVPTFTRLLAPLPDQGTYQVVMPQCYSGGFAGVLWEGGSPNAGRFRPGRCGFFAQKADRVSAGCSPDLARREEYSVAFFAALRGRDLSGRPVNADFDADGRVSSREAHGWVVASLESIDVPLSTSDAWLDAVVGRDPKRERRARGWPLAVFEKGFDPYERAVVRRIRSRLGGRDPGAAPWIPFLEAGVRDADATLEAHERAADAAQDTLDATLWRVQDDLARALPFFASPFSAHNGPSLLPTQALLSNARARFRAHPAFNDLLAQFERAREAEEAVLHATHTKASWERLERLARSHAFRRAPLSARVREELEHVTRCENEPWWP